MEQEGWDEERIVMPVQRQTEQAEVVEGVGLEGDAKARAGSGGHR